MRRRLFHTILLGCSTFISQSTIHPDLRLLTGKTGITAPKNTVLRFTENKGQVRGFDGSVHPEIKFVTGSGNIKIFVLENGLAYQFMNVLKDEREDKTTSREKRKYMLETFRVDMVLEGANKGCLVTTEGKSLDFENYYPYDAFDVRNYTSVTFHNVYPGIDWVLRASSGDMKYDFVVKPGADPSLIKMHFLSQESISLNPDGSLTIQNRLGSVVEKNPVSFQGSKRIETLFRIEGSVISFSLEDYDHNQALVIDPLVAWASYYGGNNFDSGNSCASDGFGNTYLAGQTASSNFIASSGHQNSIAGSKDAFLVKFDANGSRLWATYYGGSADDFGASCITDGSGNVYLAGATESSSGIASGGHQNTKSGGWDLFLVKFNSIGVRVWATYYGGPNEESDANCVTDASGNVYLAGTTLSTGNIATSGTHQISSAGDFEGFLVKFNTSGARAWGTYFGGYYQDMVTGCTIDPSGNIYICGLTNSYNLVANNGHQSSLGGNNDGFLAKFNPSGGRIWSTFYGGSYEDHAYACATDPSGNVYILGSSSYPSSGEISTFGAYIVNSSMSSEAFLAKFSSSGVRAWGTFLGYSNYYGEYDGCAADGAGNVYAGGEKLMKFTGNGSYEWGYTGFSGVEMNACAIAGSDKIAIAGSTNYSLTAIANGHQTTYAGMQDGWIALLSTCASPSTPGNISGPPFICGNTGGVLTYSVAPVAGAMGYAWTLPSGWNGSSTTNNITVLPSQNGGQIDVAATGTCGAGESSSIYVAPINPPQIFISPSGIYCQGMSVALEANGASSYTWSGGPTTSIYNVSPHFATTYTVRGTDLGTSCTNTATYFLQPDTTTVFNFTVTNMQANLSIRNPACSSFEWDYGNGSGSTLNSNPVVTYINPGTYGICLKCNGLPQACIRCINITVPGNRKGGVGISETLITQDILVFPNPTRDRFSMTVAEPGEAVIFNSLGEEIFKMKVTSGSSEIEMGAYPAGVYLLVFKSWSGTSVTKVIRD